MKSMIDNFRVLFGAAILIACVVVPNSYAQPVGYWPLDGDLTDASGNDNHGEIVSDFEAEFEELVAESLAGRSTRSIFLDGETAVLLGNADILNFGTNDFTISAWVLKEEGSPRGNVYSNGGDNGGGIRSVLAVGESGGDQSVVLTLDDNDTKLQARSSDPNGDGFEPVDAEDNVWNHIVGQRNGNEARVYVNGVLADSNSDIPDGYDLSGQSQLPAYIGVGASAASDPIGAFEKWFTGNIDDVAVWNVALSDEDIEALTGGESPLNLPKVIECDETTQGDLDGNGQVEFADFLILSGNFGSSFDPPDSSKGDIDCSGTVDFADFLELSGNFGNSVGQAAAVPEPSCGLLLGIGLLGFLTRRRGTANLR